MKYSIRLSYVILGLLLLDVGMAQGALTLKLAEAAGAVVGIEIDKGRAAIALAQTIGGIMLFAGLGVGLGSNTSTALAAGVTVLLVFLPPIVTILRADARPWQHYPGVVLDYATPPGYASHYQRVARADPPPPVNPRFIPRGRQRPVVDYVAARKRLYTNLGYGAAYFLAGCLFFMRRDIRLG